MLGMRHEACGGRISPPQYLLNHICQAITSVESSSKGRPAIHSDAEALFRLEFC